MIKNKFSIWVCGFVLTALMACEHNVSMETTVYPDGQLDKTIYLEVEQKQKKLKESFIHFIDTIQLNEWQALDSLEIPAYLKPGEDKKFIGYKKHFASSEEANQHLATQNDTLFRVTSSFEKKFRWFFTYMVYSDTYHAINRLDYPTTDFFTPEDFQFINRLPAEGKAITAADSLYLKQLNEKISDHYGNRAFFEEFYNATTSLIKEEMPESDLAIRLIERKEKVFQRIIQEKDLDENYIFAAVDSLPIDSKLEPKIIELRNNLERKINFISTAYDGKYTHAIHMPWMIVNTNADSVSGNSAYWSPPTIKFLLHDYSLSVEARKTNYWAIALTVLVMVGVGWLLRKKG